MKKRILSFLLAALMLGSFVYATATELTELTPRASLYLDGYGVGISAKGGGKMTVSFVV